MLTESKVSPNASDSELKTAYKKGALKHHPGTSCTTFVCYWVSTYSPQTRTHITPKLRKSLKTYRRHTKYSRIHRNDRSTISMVRKVSSRGVREVACRPKTSSRNSLEVEEVSGEVEVSEECSEVA